MLEGKEVISEHGAVAAEPEEAARIGAGVLATGGNAMDAASAAALAASMMRPHATGVAGYVCAALVLERQSSRRLRHHDPDLLQLSHDPRRSPVRSRLRHPADWLSDLR